MSAKKKYLAIGASLGGPKALKKLLPAICKNSTCPIFIAQHITQNSVDCFAQALSMFVGDYNIVVVTPFTEIKDKTIYIYPGFGHMRVLERDGLIYLDVFENGNMRYAIDALLSSVAVVYGSLAVALVLTGMGSDGLKGAQDIKKYGGEVLVQDQESSLVWSMPKSVAEHGLADKILSLESMVKHIVNTKAGLY